jgi:hypothetical protein
VAGHTTRASVRAGRVDGQKITAQASYLGNVTGRRATARSELPIRPAEIVPVQPVPARPAPEAPVYHRYLAKQHVRRDIGSRIQVLDLAAPDTPANAPPPLHDQEGESVPFLVICVTHGASKHLKAYSSAVRAAKASHHWCEVCKKELIAFHKLHGRVGSHPARK